MKKAVLVLIFILSNFKPFAQTNSIPNNYGSLQHHNPVPYRLFPTQNIWTFIKLDTRTGQMWQVQFSMKTESRFITNLNMQSLVSKDNEVNDRFTLYPTHNMYTFILLDQLLGNTWQVQWSTEPENRGIIPIE